MNKGRRKEEMARKLSQISSKLGNYIHAHYKNNPIFNGEIRAQQSGVILPKVLQVAFLRGEALFRERFFKRLEDKNIDDLLSQQLSYSALVEDKKFFFQLIQKTDMISLFKIQFSSEYDVGLLSYTLYCVLLFDMKNRKDYQLIDVVSFGFVDHFLPTLYPKESTNSDISVLKKELVRLIKQRWHINLSVKESFKTDDDVDFSLYVHANGYHSMLLIRQTGKRLKPTRLSTYKKMIELLKNSYYTLELPQPVAVKRVKE